MSKISKKLLALLLSICMICAIAPVAFAADTQATYKFSYEFDKTSYNVGDTITVTLVVDQEGSAGGFDLYSIEDQVGFQKDYLQFQENSGEAKLSGVQIAPKSQYYAVGYEEVLIHQNYLGSFIRCNDHVEIAALKFTALKEIAETPLKHFWANIGVKAGVSSPVGTLEEGRITIGDPAAITYNVSFNANGGTGSDPVIADKAESNTFVLPSNPYIYDNHTFAGWKCDADDQIYQPGSYFTMPARNVIFTAQWTQDKYNVKFIGGDGTTGEAPASTMWAPGQTVSMLSENTLKKSGYTFKGWSYNGKTYAVGETFTMPAADVTFTAVWEKNAASGGGSTAGGGSSSGGKNDQTAAPAAGACPKDASCPIEPFVDTSNTAWWHDGIHYCLENGLMNGVSKNTFAPNGTTTRGMIVTILWRMEKSPETGADMSFIDVPSGKWYTEAVRWAQSTGVVTGYSDEKFGPDDNITREQLAAILYRYASYKGIDVTARNDLSQFADAGSVSSWAVENVKWANASGLINGRNSAQIASKANATRAEAASMIQRFCENVINWKK